MSRPITALLIAAMLSLTMNVFGQQNSDIPDNYFKSDGLWYKIKGDQVRVVSPKDSPYPYSSENIVIPEYVEHNNVKYPVVSFSPEAFSYNPNLRSIVIPSTVTEIENSSFYNCSGLEKVVLPSKLSKIGDYAFYNCTGLKSFVLPASVKSVGECVFGYANLEHLSVERGNKRYHSHRNCNAIIESATKTLVAASNSTVIPRNIKAIGQGAFMGLTGIESIILPQSVHEIGDRAFECSSIKSITFNGSIEEATPVLRGWEALESVNYGPKAKSIHIPQGSTNLKTLFIPATVSRIHLPLYGYNLPNLERIVVEDGNPNYNSRGDCNAIISTKMDVLILGCINTVIPDDVTCIHQAAFNTSKIKEIHIPASVTEFYGDQYGRFADKCNELRRITVDPANPEFDSRQDCNALIKTYSNILLAGCVSTVIPISVRTIDKYAFNNLEGLKEITIPDGVRTIEKDAFRGCYNIESIYIGSDLTQMNDAFKFINGNLKWIKVNPDNKKYDSRDNCNAIIETASGTLLIGSANTVIPDGITAIGEYAFANNKDISNLTLPPSVKEIRNSAFAGCKNLAEINLDNVTAIQSGAFSGSGISNGLDSIQGYMIFQLTGKEATLVRIYENPPAEVVIPETVTHNGKEYIVTEIADGVFGHMDQIESVNIPGSVKIIGTSAFNSCTKLKSVSVGNCLKIIKNDAFANCTSLEEIELPPSLEDIGRTAFTRSGLKRLVIPESVTVIGKYITLDCKNLDSLSVRSGNTVYDSRNGCNAIIKTESDQLLEGCNTTVIPQGVIEIGAYAFAGKQGFKEMKIPNSVKYIRQQAFSFCGLERIDIPSGVRLLESNPFMGCGNLAYISVHEDNPYYSSPSGSNAIISNPDTLILGCRNTVIPPSVTIIAPEAFSFCIGLEKVDIPESVKTVKYRAFFHCPDLKELFIPASVTDFQNPEFCTALERIVVAQGNPVYDSRNDCNAVIETAGNYLVLGCKNTVIPNTVISIGSHAFQHVKGLKSIVLPNSVLEICYDAFQDCSDLESVTISKSVKYIGGYGMGNGHMGNPFFCCPNLKQITVDKENSVFDSRKDCNAIIISSTESLLVACAGTVLPDEINKKEGNAYWTLREYTFGPDYLSTKWIFNSGEIIDVFVVNHDD